MTSEPAATGDRDAREARTARELLHITSQSSLDGVLWARLLVHVAAAAMSADPIGPMAMFWDIIARPERLRQGACTVCAIFFIEPGRVFELDERHHIDY